MWGVADDISLSVPSLANVSTISFPMMLVWGPVNLVYYGCYKECGKMDM